MQELFSDQYYMQKALQQAQLAFDQDEVPIGAVIVHEDTIIAKAYNQVETLKDATAHAEILAITQASAKLNNWRLSNCILYVTKEPCAMCAGALVNARIKKVVFGSADNKLGSCGGLFSIHNSQNALHKFEVQSNVMQQECTQLLQSFFQQKRKMKKNNQ